MMSDPALPARWRRNEMTARSTSAGAKPEMRVGEDVARRVRARANVTRAARRFTNARGLTILRRVTHNASPADAEPLFHDVEFRVRYAETDQMGVVYHTNYLVWCEVGRTDFIRARGMSYADMERVGRRPRRLGARRRASMPRRATMTLIRVRTTLAEVRSRGITSTT